SFVFESIAPARGAKLPSDLRLVWRLVGAATNIIVEEPKITHPQQDRRLVVEDLRVPLPVVMYAMTNGIAPDTNSPLVRNAERMAALQISSDYLAKKDSATKRERTRSLYGVLVIAIALSPALVVFMFRKKQKQNKTDTPNI